MFERDTLLHLDLDYIWEGLLYTYEAERWWNEKLGCLYLRFSSSEHVALNSLTVLTILPNELDQAVPSPAKHVEPRRRKLCFSCQVFALGTPTQLYSRFTSSQVLRSRLL